MKFLRFYENNLRQKLFPKLKNNILEIVFIIIRYSGLGYLLKKTLAKNNVTIIVYHNPKPIIFEKHLKYLLHNYNIIPLPDLCRAIIYLKNCYQKHS